MNFLSQYHWPGNVRELENIVSRAVLKASIEYPKGETIIVEPIHLGGDISAETNQAQKSISVTASSLPVGISFREAIDEFQKKFIIMTVAKRDGNWSAAARDLGMHRSNLHNLATRLGLRKKKNKKHSG